MNVPILLSLAAALTISVEVPRVTWPVRFDADRPGACDAIPPGAIRVREDGETRPVTATSRRSMPTMHVLAIDASASMVGRMDRVRDAALAYLEQIPQDEPVMLLRFSDAVVMAMPPGLDRRRLGEAVRDLPVGRYTALWDAVHDLAVYLQPLPGRKIVVLLSDGCDTTSLPEHPFGEVIQRAAWAPHLSLFAIGIDLPARCPASRAALSLSAPPQNYLDMVARRTGGRFYGIRQLHELPGILAEIRERLRSEGFVTYIPQPFGEGPDDRPGQADHHWRRVEIRGGRPGCRIRRAGPPLRLAHAPGALPPWAVAPADPDGFGPATRLPEVLAAPAEPPPMAPYVRWSEGMITARVQDLVQDRGELFEARSAAAWVPPAGRPAEIEPRPGGMRLHFQETADWAVREVVLELPDPETVRRSLRSSEDVVLWLLDGAGEGAEAAAALAAPHSALVHGETLLQMREALGLALRLDPAYRDWADGRLDGERRRLVEALLAPEVAAGRSPPEQIEAARRALLERPVPPGDPQRFLAEWLGDVPALELAAGLDRRFADMMLRGAGTADSSGRDDDGLRRRWPGLRALLPPASRIRLVAPLIPAYDPDRDVFGFYRLVLPHPMRHPSSAEILPLRPLGLETVDWLRELDEAGAALAGLTVAEVRYGVLEPRRERILGPLVLGIEPATPDGEPREFRSVELDLRPQEEPEAVLVLQAVWFGEYLVCTDAPRWRAEPGRRRAGDLNAVLEEARRLCPSGS